MLTLPQIALNTLRTHLAEHLRQEYAWQGQEPFDDLDLDESNLIEYLYAALAYVMDTYSSQRRQGASPKPTEIPRDYSNIDLFSALLNLEPRTLDAILNALVQTIPLSITRDNPARIPPFPRAYRYQPSHWPDILGSSIGNREFDAWFEHRFGIIAKPNWQKDSEERKRVFAAVDATYHQLNFIEIDRESAKRLACFLLAGPESKGSFKQFKQQAEALITVLGPKSKIYCNKDLDEQQLKNPFEHGEPVDLGSADTCAGASMLALVITDEQHIIQLEALWDRWVES